MKFMWDVACSMSKDKSHTLYIKLIDVGQCYEIDACIYDNKILILRNHNNYLEQRYLNNWDYKLIENRRNKS